MSANLQHVATIKIGDVCQALGITSAQVRKRIAEGIYPRPNTSESGRFIYTIGWLDIAAQRELEFKQIMLRLEQRKLQVQRRTKEIQDILGA